jgi:ribonuclease-3
MDTTHFSPLENRLGIEFNNKDLLAQAFTHRSYLNESQANLPGHNERLEFLGDAVLELVVTDYLYTAFPDTPEGQLTAYRAALVRTESISDTAVRLGFNEYLLLSKGESRDMGKARSYILANSFEAFVGALYMDQGYDAASKFIHSCLVPEMVAILDQSLWRDAKSFVQEKAQELLGVTPTYELVRQEGPDHDRTFVVAIQFGSDSITEGSGTSKQEAQQDAARKALIKMGWN